MKRVVALAFLAWLIAFSGQSAMSWEFTLAGEAEWRYRYVSRTGPNDLFGNAEIAQQTPSNGTSIGLAGPAPLVYAGTGGFYGADQSNAVLLEGYSSKGSDASYAETRFWLYPEFKVNPAISIRSIIKLQGNLNGNYIGGNNWATNGPYGGWIMADSRGTAASSGYVAPIIDAFWAKAQLPWGTFMLGGRPAGFGMGWLMHENDIYTRSVSLLVPYGPFMFAISQYYQDKLEVHSSPNDGRNTAKGSQTIASAPDKNLTGVWSQSYAVVYRSGDLDIGSMCRIIKTPKLHSVPQGPVGTFPTGTFRDDNYPEGLLGVFFEGTRLNYPTVPIYGEAFFVLGASYLKYTNGRFFLNAEYDFQVIEARRDGGRPISGFPQGWAGELGAFAGPGKITLAHFYRSGHDRRGGRFNTSNATGLISPGVYAYDKWESFLSLWGGGDSPIKPYNFLLGLYGTGNNGFDATGRCSFEDFLAFAGRIDYAVAANLNLFASYIQAYRASATGTPRGLYNGTWTGDITNSVQPGDPAAGTAVQTPNVSNSGLGWELDAGFNWKLLEGLSFNFLAAYWQPGGWFKEAYRDMTVSLPDPSTSTDVMANQGVVNSRRSIDALMALQGSFLIDF